MKEQINLILGYVHGFWRYRWSALLISWIVGVFGALFVLALPNQYEVKAVLNIDTTSIMRPLLKGLAVETDATQEINVVNKILLSRENLLSVIRETDMDLNVNTPRAKEELIAKLMQDITLKGGRRQRAGSNIYQISYQSSSPQQTYQVVSVLLNIMMERLLNASRTDTAVAQKFLDSQIAEYEARLSAAEMKMAAFKKENVGMMPGEEGGYYVRLQNAQDRVDSLRADLRLAKQRYAELSRLLSSERPLLVNDAYASAPRRTQLQRYQEQLADLLSRYTDKHPNVLELKARIVELSQNEEIQFTDNIDTAVDSTPDFNPVYQELKLEVSRASVEIEELKVQLSEQEEKVVKLKGLIDAIPGVEAKLSELNRDYDITRERYLELIGRRESARLAEVASQSSSEVTVSIIEPPIIPVVPIGPNRPLLLFFALIGALGAGIGWCVLRYMLSPTVINVNQLRQELEYPVFGEVAYFVTPSVKRRRWFQLTSFLIFVSILAVAYLGVIWKQEEGSNMVRTFIAEYDQQ